MNSITKIVLVILVLAGGYLLFLNVGEAPSNESGMNKKYAIKESKEIAKNWIETESPTYTYDGSNLSLKGEKVVEVDVKGYKDIYKFAFSFESSHGGFGDRKGKMITQVITPHIMTVTIENGEVVGAITDNKFDEMSDEIRQGEQGVGHFQSKKVSLFYYNFEADKNGDENVLCSADAVQPVERIVEEKSIEETIKMLLGGEIKEYEAEIGFQSEFPNSDFKLLDINLKDGVLTLEFTEVPGFTSGGSCRVELLKAQIEKTAMQFPEVDGVVIEPETLFQP